MREAQGTLGLFRCDELLVELLEQRRDRLGRDRARGGWLAGDGADCVGDSGARTTGIAKIERCSAGLDDLEEAIHACRGALAETAGEIGMMGESESGEPCYVRGGH